MSTPVVAIIGRPNVGKSELFNRIIGDHIAIVSEEAGTTRDRNFGKAEWGGRNFWLVDTGGINDDQTAQMDVEIRKQVDAAIGEADLLLFVVDAKAGVHPVDYHVADLLRTSGRPWLVVANKVDDPKDPAYYEFFNMGLGDPFPVSAINGKGSGDLLDVIVEKLPQTPPEDDTAIRVAVIGKPNVGKSSFVNRLLGETRLVVSDIPGTTRDSIDTPMKYHGNNLIFIDTAGLRRQSRLEDGIEFYSSLRTRKAIERSEICILVMDATEGEIQNQDLKIAALAWESGRGLIVAVNKWDIAEKDDKAAQKYEKAACEKAPFLNFVPFLFTSALTGQRVTKVLDVILKVHEERHKRVPTSAINERLAELLARRQPPQAAGREIRLNYATQVETAPPTIAVFGNNPDLVAEHYIRFLHNGFRETYPFDGNPLRILMRRKS
ncbi:MAG TPA: ribosome biogenesis GTPase Der [Gemmatimonadaceae bacterium]|nr:ribosome biogenesis GTPase Der [Gemmatimonadaceae bacterium]